MDDLCTACLSADRNLFYIKHSEIYPLYIEILNEISISTNMLSVCLQVCWECHALLRKFQRFKKQVQESYSELLGAGNQNLTCKLQKSHLQRKQLPNYCYPENLMVEQDLGVKVEKTEELDTHCEPETFVNDFAMDEEETKPEHGKKIVKRKPKLKVTLKRKRDTKIKPVSDADSEVDCLDSLTPESDFPCKQCELSFLDEVELDKHINTQHAVKRLKKTKQKVKLKRGKMKEPKGESASESGLGFPCGDCTLSFADELQLQRHSAAEHAVKSSVGRAGAKAEGAGRRGLLPDKPQCVECGKMFSSRKTYRYHLNVLHRGQNRYPCPRCGKVYQWKSNLGRHMRSHKARDNGELHCDTCDKRFASVATFRQHLRVSRQHVSENDFTFMCNECGKKFVNKTRLRDHIDWEHLKKIKFRCQLCDKPFKCHTSLYVHVQNVHHNKEKKENLCHVCGKSYPNAAKLKYHIVAMHTSETPYRCAQCGAAFGWYSSLYRHVREVHYKVKLQPNRIRKKGKKAGEAGPLMQQAGPS